jgi:hypothetical protein
MMYSKTSQVFCIAYHMAQIEGFLKTLIKCAVIVVGLTLGTFCKCDFTLQK